jgi:hypothetical protein
MKMEMLQPQPPRFASVLHARIVKEQQDLLD